VDNNQDSVTPDGEALEASPQTEARRREISAALMHLGLIASDNTERNPAVDVLAALLPADAEIEVCLSCHRFSSSEAYPFREASGLFLRPTTSVQVRAGYWSAERVVPPLRTDLVLCTKDALQWTRSTPRIRGTAVVGDDVTLYSLPFTEILGATVHNRHKGELEVWLDEATLTFRTTPSEVDSLCAYIDRASTSE
jgi:hypothetical protein